MEAFLNACVIIFMILLLAGVFACITGLIWVMLEIVKILGDD